MKKLIFTFYVLLTYSFVSAQNQTPRLDSLKILLLQSHDDTNRIIRLAELCHEYAFHNFDSSIVYGEKVILLSEKNNYLRGKARAYFGLGRAYQNHGDLSKAFEFHTLGLKTADDNQYLPEKAACLMNFGFFYSLLSDYPKAKDFYLRSTSLSLGVGTEFIIQLTL